MKTTTIIICMLLLFASLPSTNAATATDTVYTRNSLVMQDSLAYVKSINRDWQSIKKTGKLKVMVVPGPTDYYFYKGLARGFAFEMLWLFCQEEDLQLVIEPVKDTGHMYHQLLAGKGDLLALPLPVTRKLQQFLSFSEPLLHSRLMLVQKKPDNWQDSPGQQTSNHLVANVFDLDNKTVHLPARSPFVSQLQGLSAQSNIQTGIAMQSQGSTTAQMLQRVASGELPLTVAPGFMARVYKKRFLNLHTNLPVSLPQQYAWAFRKSSPELREKFNQFVKKARRSGILRVLVERYYHDPENIVKKIASPFYLDGFQKGDISRNDAIIRKYARTIDWDWRLLAALICQESRFERKIVSFAGAQGLMQVMPVTARHYGISNPYDPEQNIKAGTRFISFLGNFWQEIKSPEQRLKFVLASYNAGPGHVQDARRLAAEHGKSDQIWKNHVASYLALKAEKKWYRHPLVKYGYCRGKEPCEYVDKVLENYKRYCDLLDWQTVEATVKRGR